MSLSPESLAELRVKHLDMIQGVIARVAGYGATLKNYCITLATALCGFAVTLQHPYLAVVSLMPIILFAALDAQFLRVERRFRALYDEVRKQDWNSVPTFEISLTNAPQVSYCDVLASWSITIFYIPLAGIVLAVAAALGWLHA